MEQEHNLWKYARRRELYPVWNSSALPSTCSAIAPRSMKLQSIVIVHVHSSNHENTACDQPSRSFQAYNFAVANYSDGMGAEEPSSGYRQGFRRDPLSRKCHFDRTLTISINCPSTSNVIEVKCFCRDDQHVIIALAY